MPGVLTTGSTVMCPHGGQASLGTANSKTSAASGKILLESDVHQVAGCSFMIGNTPSPCVKIEWSAGASKVKANGTKVLLQSSSGTCYSAASAPQGSAIVASADMKVKA